MYVILVGPDGQVVRYDGQAVPRGEALRVFLANGWRPRSRWMTTPLDSAGAASEPRDPSDVRPRV